MHLALVAEGIGEVPLAELTSQSLAHLRTAVVARLTFTKQVELLSTLRTFLLWAAEHGYHALKPPVVQNVLRSPRGPRIAAPPIGTDSPWLAPTLGFLADRPAKTRRTYARQLAQAASMLGGCPLAKLTGEALAAYRAAVLEDGRSPITHASAISTLRSFLLWTAEQGWHALSPEVVKDALRLPRGYEQVVATLADRFHTRAQAASQSARAAIRIPTTEE